MSIRMQYPLISGNNLCDGNIHTITPRSISSFNYNGSEFLILIYDDDTKGSRNAFTILRREGSNFYKVPLYDYDDFGRKIKEGKFRINVQDLSILNNVHTIYSDTPIRTIDDFDKPSRHINVVREDLGGMKENRLEMVRNACTLIIEAIAWRQGYYDIPSPLKEALESLYAINFDALSKIEFELLISWLKEQLNSCIKDPTGANIALGPSEVDIPRATRIIWGIVSEFSRKIPITAAQAAAAAGGSPPPPPPPPPPGGPDFDDDDKNPFCRFFDKKRPDEPKDNKYDSNVKDEKQFHFACIVLPPEFIDKNVSDIYIPAFRLDSAKQSKDKNSISYGPGNIVYDLGNLKKLLEAMTKNRKKYIGPVSREDAQKFVTSLDHIDQYYFVVCDSEEKYRSIQSNLWNRVFVNIEIPDNWEYKELEAFTRITSNKNGIVKNVNAKELAVFINGIIGNFNLSVSCGSIGTTDNKLSEKSDLNTHGSRKI